MELKLSIVICTYNSANFLSQALRAVAEQTVQDFELLVVDDGSSDHTEQVARSAADTFQRLKYVRKAHTGLPDSRNVGIETASGTHISFLDADDLWAPDYLEILTNAFRATPEADLVCCNGLRIYADGAVFGSLFPAGLPQVRGPLKTPAELFSFFPYVLPSGMIFKKALYERVGKFDTAYPLGTDDWHWIIRAAQQGAFFIRIDRTLVLYRHHTSNLTKDVKGTLREWFYVYNDIWRNQTAGEEIETLAGSLTLRHLRGVLARCPTRESRALLTEAIGTHQNDWRLKAVHTLTYMGLCGVLRLFFRLRQFCRAPWMRRLDLTSPAKQLFSAAQTHNQ